MMEDTSYDQFQQDLSSSQLPKTLRQYILDTDQPDQNVMARNYFYKSWVFRVMLLLPNLICILGGTYLFYIEGTSASEHQKQADAKRDQSTSDPKGAVWILGGLITAAGFVIWVFWATVGMFASRLFRKA